MATSGTLRISNRSYGGVHVVTLFTAPSQCGGHCVFCPGVDRLPRSYVWNGSTTAAEQAAFSPRAQFERYTSRLQSIEGIIPIEVVVLGGSFSHLPADYRTCYLEELYRTMGTVGREAAERSDSYLPSIVTVECRPDQITLAECEFLRSLGVSKVEIGVQHLDDRALAVSGREYGYETIVSATRLLKEAGFKVGYHIMLGMPGSTKETDLEMLAERLWLRELCPDFLKVYPCVLLKDRQLQPALYRLVDHGHWKPPSLAYVQEMLTVLWDHVSPLVRISRIQRFFAEDTTAGGFFRGLGSHDRSRCRCIRCREAGIAAPNLSLDESQKINVRFTLVGREVHYEAVYENDILLGLARLRNLDGSNWILRELHVYGQAAVIGRMGPIQGRGIGRTLLSCVEKHAKAHGGKSLLINAAPGARPYFLRCGYSVRRDLLLSKELTAVRPVTSDIQQDRAAKADSRSVWLQGTSRHVTKARDFQSCPIS